jgi:cell division protein FtsB
MKVLFWCLLGALVLLQYRLWLSDEGMREVWALEQSVAAQLADNAVLAERNAQQRAEVTDLKQGFTALEERARDLGMIGGNETFYQYVDLPYRPVGDPAPSHASAQP